MTITGSPKEPMDRNPSFNELIPSVEDQHNPHHEEVVKRNQVIARHMESLMDSIEFPTFSVPESIARLFKNSLISDSLRDALYVPQHSHITNLTKEAQTTKINALAPALSTITPPFVDYSLATEALKTVIRKEWKERIEREQQSIELCQIMGTQITEPKRKNGGLSSALDSINSSLKESDKSATRAHKSSMIVGWLTLLVTSIGVAATIVFFFLGS